jgi:hypothetical protein
MVAVALAAIMTALCMMVVFLMIVSVYACPFWVC